MKLLFAQGNPGAEYAHSRHNVGWRVLDALARDHGATFQPKPKFFADIAELTLHGEKILLVKPQTFYNETGRAARALVDFYKLDTDDILVIHDDLAIQFGTLRVREQGSDAGNNGIKSLNAHLGGQYWRLRVGILSPLRGRMSDATFVLGRFSEAERQALDAHVYPACITLIGQFIRGDLAATSATLLQ